LFYFAPIVPPRALNWQHQCVAVQAETYIFLLFLLLFFVLAYVSTFVFYFAPLVPPRALNSELAAPMRCGTSRNLYVSTFFFFFFFVICFYFFVLFGFLCLLFRLFCAASRSETAK
jgi:hypothetical protein